jgi:hypothetical protein
MAKKPILSRRKSAGLKRARGKPSSTPVRNTAVPKASRSRRREVTHEQIARRAYDIYLSGTGGSEHDNWLRAERELRSQ